MKKRNEKSKKAPACASSRFESEMAAAKAALREAAKTLAMLAREEPRLTPPPSIPHPPMSPQRMVHVYPTGHHRLDVENLERAITKVGPGGVVVLKATDKSGKPMHFNLTKVDELFMQHEVTLKSEKNAVMRFSD